MVDTGPPYPPARGFGQTGLGKFQLGVDVLGTLAQFNYYDTVISQYANSPIMDAILAFMPQWADPTIDLDNFYDAIWNIDTALDFGLDIWGRILGINRVVSVAIGTWFGFEEELPGVQSFNNGPFYGGQPLTASYNLATEAYRKLLLAKAAFNITNGSIQAINGIMAALFAHRPGNAYVQDGFVAQTFFGFEEATNTVGFNQAPFYNGAQNLNMQMTYTFEFPLTPLDIAIINSGVLPRPAGVNATVQILS